MQFLVIGRLIDTPVAPPPQEIALLKATFAQFAGGVHPQIKAVYPFADQRATALLIEAQTGDELALLLGALPGSRLSTFESHPLTTAQNVVALLSQWEQSLAGQ